MADDMGIPTASGAVPPWATVGAQLLDALLSRLKSDDPGGPRDGGDPDRPPRDGGPSGGGRLQRACRMLGRRNARAARALGACRCWGLSPGCPICGGGGRPGTFEVDPAAFSQLVLPLLEAQPELFLRHLGAVEVVSEQQEQ
jgi:hypothetical protein